MNTKELNLKKIGTFPSVKKEINYTKLAHPWDKQTSKQMIESNLDLALKYINSGCLILRFIQERNRGLIKTGDKLHSEEKNRFYF